MAEDWNPGDLAICIRKGRWVTVAAENEHGAGGPEYGKTYRVAMFVPEDLGPNRCCGQGYLGLAGFEGHIWCAAAFRKVRPDTEPATDAEIIALIKGVGREVPA